MSGRTTAPRGALATAAMSRAVARRAPVEPATMTGPGNRSASRRAISCSTKIAPRSAEIVDTLGWMKIQGSDRAGGYAILQRARTLAPENPQIGYHLAVAMDQAGKHAEAKALLQSVLVKSPNFEGVDDAKRLLATW